MQMLDRDIIAMHETLEQNAAAYAARESTASAGERCLWFVIVDLFRRSHQCAAGASILLARGALVPVFPLLRQVYESMITLAYLSKQSDREFEAQVAVAHEYAHACWVWDQLEPPGNTRTSDPAIARLQKDIDEAKRKRDAFNPDGRARHVANDRRRGGDWTGKPRKEIIKGLTGSTDEYFIFYSRLSQVSHPHSLVGGYMRIPRPNEVNQLAQLTRMYLRDAWKALVYWMPVPLSHPWLDDPGTAI